MVSKQEKVECATAFLILSKIKTSKKIIPGNNNKVTVNCNKK